MALDEMLVSGVQVALQGELLRVGVQGAEAGTPGVQSLFDEVKAKYILDILSVRIVFLLPLLILAVRLATCKYLLNPCDVCALPVGSIKIVEDLRNLPTSP